MAGGRDEMPANIKSAGSRNVIPENERWLHRPPAADKLTRAIEWAEKHPPKASKLDAVERILIKRLRSRPRRGR